MQFHLIAMGRLRNSPELDLINDYLERFTKAGRNLSLGPISIIELENKKGGGMSAEAELIRKAIPKGSLKVILDERGRVLSSPDFAQKLSQWRDQGSRDLSIIIGGADGLDPGLRKEADFSLSFGKMVWPHMLVRVMLSEQLYRAASILSGSPYHRN